jgi:hypothetical protein
MARRWLAAAVQAVLEGLAHANPACLQTADESIDPSADLDHYCAHGLAQLEKYLHTRARFGPA